MARVWRRRRSLDTPRPRGRRWARLRRSGSRATQVLARVTGTDRSWRRIVARRSRRGQGVGMVEQGGVAPVGSLALGGVVPVSPAVGPFGDYSGTPAPRPVGPVTIPLLPGERSLSRRIKFAVANGCTIASLLAGMAAVFLALKVDIRLGALMLLACVVLDGCDGALARRFGVASPFGAQMDSLADLGSFGVATGVVVYQWLWLQGADPFGAALATALVAVCAAIRLARFNVSPKDGRYFAGVPTTMASAVLALTVLINPDIPPNAAVVGVAVYAVAMVTSLPYAKMRQVRRLPMWVWLVPGICLLVSVPATLGIVVGGYLVSGPVLWFAHRRQDAYRRQAW